MGESCARGCPERAGGPGVYGLRECPSGGRAREYRVRLCYPHFASAVATPMFLPRMFFQNIAFNSIVQCTAMLTPQQLSAVRDKTARNRMHIIKCINSGALCHYTTQINNKHSPIIYNRAVCVAIRRRKQRWCVQKEAFRSKRLHALNGNLIYYIFHINRGTRSVT